MKRYVAQFLSGLLLVALTACGGQQSSAQTAASNSTHVEASNQTTAPALSASGTAEQTADPELVYGELVEWYRKLVSDPLGQDSEKDEESSVLEAARILGENAAYEMGYLVEDLSGDGIPELAIGQRSGPINALYTLVNGEPKLVFVGRSRSDYVYMGRGRFQYFGSNSAPEAAKGVFVLSEDGRELSCESFFFDCLNSAGDALVYSNKTGSWDPAQSELSDMTDEEFWKLDTSGTPLPLIPFAASGTYWAEMVEPPVSVRYLTQVGEEEYHWVTLYDSQDACCILLTTDSPVTDFTLLYLSVEDYTETGAVIFKDTPVVPDEERDSLPSVMTPETPVAVQLNFSGDLPAYGFSYKDQNGKLHRFVIEVSGENGALLLREASPMETRFILPGRTSK